MNKITSYIKLDIGTEIKVADRIWKVTSVISEKSGINQYWAEPHPRLISEDRFMAVLNKTSPKKQIPKRSQKIIKSQFRTPTRPKGSGNKNKNK